MPSNLIHCEILLLAAMFAGTNAASEMAVSSSLSIVDSVEDIDKSILPLIDYMEFHALPVGQGDCTIIRCPGSTEKIVVVDCGSSGGNRFTPQQVEYYLRLVINQVVAIIITHPDRDHFNYLPSINWNKGNIQAVIIGGTLQDYYKPTSPDFDKIYKWLQEFQNQGKLQLINNGQSCIGNCPVYNFCGLSNTQFDILAANVGTRSNEKSIVMKVSHDQFSMLLAGDVEGSAATSIANTLGARLQSTVYKIAHHGASRLANSVTWLTPIKPYSAFASSAYNFGNCRHPRCEAIRRIENLRTIVQADNHAFYCGNSAGQNPTDYPRYDLSIYATSPTPNMICILVYQSSYHLFNDCDNLLRPSHDFVAFNEEDPCPDEDKEEIDWYYYSEY